MYWWWLYNSVGGGGRVDGNMKRDERGCVWLYTHLNVYYGLIYQNSGYVKLGCEFRVYYVPPEDSHGRYSPDTTPPISLLPSCVISDFVK